MRDSVHDGLRDNFFRNLIGHRSPYALGARTYRKREFAQHEVYRLVDKLEGSALVDLIVGYRLGDLLAMEVGALDFGRVQEPLRCLSEQEQRRVSQSTTIQEV